MENGLLELFFFSSLFFLSFFLLFAFLFLFVNIPASSITSYNNETRCLTQQNTTGCTRKDAVSRAGLDKLFSLSGYPAPWNLRPGQIGGT